MVKQLRSRSGLMFYQCSTIWLGLHLQKYHFIYEERSCSVCRVLDLLIRASPKTLYPLLSCGSTYEMNTYYLTKGNNCTKNASKILTYYLPCTTIKDWKGHIKRELISKSNTYWLYVMLNWKLVGYNRTDFQSYATSWTLLIFDQNGSWD